MRSELIGEIFSVESEADRLISQARQEARDIILSTEQACEQLLQREVAQARAEREKAIAQAQEEARTRVEEEKARLERSDAQDRLLDGRAEEIADAMVRLLCATKVGETRT